MYYCIVGKFGGERLANWLFSNFWQKKVWQINGSANRLLIESINLYGFSLANHGWFAKFAKLSPCQTFPLYGNICTHNCIQAYIMCTHLKGGGHGKTYADFIGQIFNLDGVETQDKIFGIH